MRILVFLMVFVPWFLQAQTLLKAGSYHNLKRDKPIVLDSGVFTFISLEFIPVPVLSLARGVYSYQLVLPMGKHLKAQKMVIVH